MRLGFFRQRTPTAANVVGLGLGTIVFGMFFPALAVHATGAWLLRDRDRSRLPGRRPDINRRRRRGAGARDADRCETGATTGLAPIAGGLILFTQISVDVTYVGNLLPGFLMIGVGLGFSFVPVSIAALSVRTQDAGLASGLINTSQQIGGALGVAILTTVATVADREPGRGRSSSTRSADQWLQPRLLGRIRIRSPLDPRNPGRNPAG